MQGMTNIADIAESFSSLSKAQQNAVLASNVLSSAQKEQITSGLSVILAQQRAQAAYEASATAMSNFSEAQKLYARVQAAEGIESEAAIAAQARLAEAEVAQASAAQAAAAANSELAAAEAAAGAAGGGAAAGVGTLGAVMSGLGATIMAYAPILATIGLVSALAYEISYIATAQQRAEEAASNAASTYQSESSTLDHLISQYETNKTQIEELNSLKKSGDITNRQLIELDNLKAQNTELERQIELQQKKTDTARIESAEASMQAAGTTNKADKLVGSSFSFKGLFTDPEATLFGENSADAVTQANKEIKKIKDLQEKRAKAVETYNNAAEGSEERLNAAENIESFDARIDEAQSNLSEQTSKLEGYLANAQDESGKMLDGLSASARERYKEVQSTLNEAALLDTTPYKLSFEKLDSLFSSSMNSDMKDYIVDMMNAGMSAEEAINSLGYSLEELGVPDSSAFEDYFEDIITSSKLAEKQLQNTSKKMNTSMSDIAAAMESENAGAQYESLKDYLDKANELYKLGKTGVDDFESVAKFISPDNTSLKESKNNWGKYYDNISKYFTVDKDGNQTSSGLKKMVSDLKSTGKQFDTTAEAAKELGISTRAFEALLGGLEDYDISTKGVFSQKNIKKSAELYDQASSSLDGIRETYDSLQSGSTKDALGKQIENWQEQLDKAEGDLDSLDTDILLEINLAANMAELQSQVDQARAEITANGGTAATKEQAMALNTANYKVNEAWAEQNGFNKKGFEVPVQFQTIDGAEDQLRQQLAEATANGDDETFIKVSAQLDKVEDLESSLHEAFSKKYPIDVDNTSVEDLQSMWTEFLSSAEAQEILLNFGINLDGLNEDNIESFIAELLGISEKDVTVTINAEDNTEPGVSSAESNIESIDVDGTTITITAVDNTTPTTQEIAQYLNQLPTEQKIELGIDGLTPEEIQERLESGAITINPEVNTDGVAEETQAAVEDQNYTANVEGQMDELDTSNAEGEVVPLDARVENVDTSSGDYPVIDAEGNIIAYSTGEAGSLVLDAEGKLVGINTAGVGTPVVDAQGNIIGYTGVAPTAEVNANANVTSATDNTGGSTEVNARAVVNSVKNNAGVVGVKAQITGITNGAQSAGGTVNWSNNSSTVDSYASQQKKSNGIVNWKNNRAAVDAFASATHRASGTVYWGNNTANVKTHFSASGTVNWSNGGVSVNGTAHAQGTAHNISTSLRSGTAKASGDWGVKQNQTSLINELGEELIVRSGKWFTVNNGYPTFTKLRRGDIVY